MAASSNDATKLQQHLDLLREEYVKLQQRYSDLEQKHTRAIATSGNVGPDHFVSKLVKLVADLYDKSLYSDIEIILADRKMPGHKFVLTARSRRWNQDETLTSTSELNFSHMTPFVASSMIRWVYTDSIILPSEQTAMIELLGASNKYHLVELKEKCEQALISSVTVRNCIKLYQTSEEHGASALKKYCLQMISSHWNSLNTSDFAELSAPLLYDMFKAHSEYPLHLAIQHLREDVVFLFLIEHNAQLPQKLNECDNNGNIPLNLALLNRHDSIAKTLVSHKCDLDIQDKEGNSLLHLAILRGDSFAASFLIRNGANTILVRRENQETPLHLVAAYKPSQALTTVSTAAVKEAPWPSESMAQIASLLLQYHANPDSQDSNGYTPLQKAIECDNDDVFTILLTNPVLNLELRNSNRETALWLALKQLDSDYLTSEDISMYEYTYASRLIKRGSNADAIDSHTGNSLLHQAALESNEAAAVFLVHNGALPNSKNSEGEAPIHIASANGLHVLVEKLLQNGADPNLQTALKPKPAVSAVQLAMTPSGSNFGTPVGSMTRMEDFATMDNVPMSPSTLGALSALTMTTQAALNTSVPISSGYDSLGGQTPQQMSQSLMMMSSQIPTSPGMGMESSKDYKGYNPFGSDSDEDEPLAPAPSQPPASYGYRVSPLPKSPTHGGTTELHNRAGLHDGMGGSARNSPLMKNAPFQKVRSSSSSSGGPRSMVTPTPPRLPSLSDEIEFIKPPEVFDVSDDPGGRTALHLAIVHKHPKVVAVLLEHKGNSSSGKLEIGLNVNLRDGHEESPLGLALWTDQYDIAQQLLDIGADIECVDSEEPGMLYLAIIREKEKAARFLLDNGANFKKRTPQNESLLILSICHQLESVADRLCELGIDLTVADNQGNSALWVAMRSKQLAVANKLVIHGCDPNAWHLTSDGTALTLLHRAIILRDTSSACFLIRHAADINSPSRPSGGTTGETPSMMVIKSEDQVFMPPLHMASERGLQEVVLCLVEHNVNVNAKDSIGRSALHISITCKQPSCSDILLAHPDLDLSARDKNGHTPFAAAMAVKDNKAGLAILNREPNAAEQVDSKGQNFLHLAVLNQDVEGVIFLLSVRADINSKVLNPTHNTPLHYAVKGGSEILVRHLLLAGARVGDVDNHQRAALHMAAEGDYPTILSVLIEHAANPDLADESGNNALHLSMQLGHISCARILLEDSNADLFAVNMNGQNCLHILSKYGKENAAAIFSLLKQVAPNYPVNKQDAEGYTPLLLAYIGGNSGLCDILVRSGAHPGMANRQGVSMFNAPVATKQLLFRILDQIHTEPTWLEGNFCQNCNTKFSISHRKHHCRHCGRLLCKQCTSHQLPILKFDLSKPVRVCEVCADSFRLGATR